MRKKTLFWSILIILIAVSCTNGEDIATMSLSTTPVPPPLKTPTLVSSTFTPPHISLETSTPIATSTATLISISTATATIIPSEALLQTQCLDIEPTLPSTTRSNGFAVLDRQIIIDGQYTNEALLLNMETMESSPMAPGDEYMVSPNKNFLAYITTVFDAQNNILHKDLFIVDAYGQQVQIIPWQQEWAKFLGWANNENLIFDIFESGEQTVPPTIAVFNLNTREEQIIYPNFPDFFYEPSTILPYWDGWYGVIYDPGMTRAVYPRFVGADKELLTYGLWDLLNNDLVVSFEHIFAVPAIQNNLFPRPYWSPDGSQFVFEGAFIASDNLVHFELFKITQDGQIKQLTNLTSLKVLDLSNLSWSPDERYLAIFLSEWGGNLTDIEASSLAVLDMETLMITDYCLKVSQIGVMSSTPIWSPDSSQLLIGDAGTDQVVFVDLVNSIAVYIADNMKPIGWMVAP